METAAGTATATATGDGGGDGGADRSGAGSRRARQWNAANSSVASSPASTPPDRRTRAEGGDGGRGAVRDGEGDRRGTVPPCSSGENGLLGTDPPLHPEDARAPRARRYRAGAAGGRTRQCTRAGLGRPVRRGRARQVRRVRRHRLRRGRRGALVGGMGRPVPVRRGHGARRGGPSGDGGAARLRRLGAEEAHDDQTQPEQPQQDRPGAARSGAGTRPGCDHTVIVAALCLRQVNGSGQFVQDSRRSRPYGPARTALRGRPCADGPPEQPPTRTARPAGPARTPLSSDPRREFPPARPGGGRGCRPVGGGAGRRSGG